MNKKTRNFIFDIYIGNVDYPCGQMTMEGKDGDEAQDAITETVGTRLYEAFPQLDIIYTVGIAGCNGKSCDDCFHDRYEEYKECKV